jgi:hypothetical protein
MQPTIHFRKKLEIEIKITSFFCLVSNILCIPGANNIATYVLYRVSHERLPMKISLYATQNTETPRT